MPSALAAKTFKKAERHIRKKALEAMIGDGRIKERINGNLQ